MDVVESRNETVEASFKAFNEMIKPVIKRKNARLRTCGSRDDVTYHPATGRLPNAMLSKPTRWIVRIEGDLDKPDDLNTHAERCIGSFNLNGGADLIGVRVLLLHRRTPDDPWVAVPKYEHRLLILSRPPFPTGSSSNTVHCMSAAHPLKTGEKSPDCEDEEPARIGEPAPLSDDLWLQRRNGPAQQVCVEASLLLSPPTGSIEGLSQAHQCCLEEELLKALTQWSPSVWRGEKSSKAAMSFARAFDALEAPALAETIAEGNIAAPETQREKEIPPDTLRRARKALRDGFQRFVIVSLEPSLSYALGDMLASHLEVHPVQVSRLHAMGDDLAYSEHNDIASLVPSACWILHTARQQEALRVLDRARVDQTVIWLTIPNAFDELSLLKKAYTQNGIEVPDESALRLHALLRTAKIMKAETAGAMTSRILGEFYQVCLHHAPHTDWQSLTDDTVRQVWVDALVMLFPSMLAGLPLETRLTLLTQLCEQLEIPASEERLLKTLLTE